MELDELKKSMATLDDLLAQKSRDEIRLDAMACETAQKRIMKMYRNGVFSFAFFAAGFLIAWKAGLGRDAFPLAYKVFFEIIMVTGVIWYSYLYFRTKKISVGISTPVQTLKQVASLRFCALVGEISVGMMMVVFFTLFLSNLWIVGRYRFWIVSAATIIYIVVLITVLIPRIIRDFNNLTAMK